MEKKGKNTQKGGVYWAKNNMEGDPEVDIEGLVGGRKRPSKRGEGDKGGGN